MDTRTYEEELRGAGLSVTKQRLAIIKELKKARKPLSAEALADRVGDGVNQTTVYRALEQFVVARLARRIDLRENYALYESADHHHHHLVCHSCGHIEDVSDCLPGSLYERVLKKNPRFALIEDHALEFFGICTTCSKKGLS